MAQSYCTVDDVKLSLPDIIWDGRDALLSTLCSDASRAVDAYTRRESGSFAVDVEAVRYFDGDGSATLWIHEGLADTPSEVAIATDATLAVYETVTDYILYPVNALQRQEPYSAIILNPFSGLAWCSFPKGIRITGYFGFSRNAPDIVKRATIIQVCRWYMRGQQSYQDVGGTSELGQKTYKSGIDADIAVMLDHLVAKVI